MTRINYMRMKNELKSLAKEIRQEKDNFKSQQREYSKIENEHGCAETVYMKYMDPKYNHELYKNVRDTMSKVGSTVNTYRCNVWDLQSKFRHLHIVYCLARGKTLEQIEPKVKDQGTWYANTPKKELIEQIKKEYGFDDVREEVA